MTQDTNGRGDLVDMDVPPKLKLAMLWASAMFLYVYGDIFDLFRASRIEDILAGKTPVGETTQLALLSFSLMMAIPGLMVVLSVILKPAINRGANLIVGAAFTIIVALTMRGAWNFYLFLGSIDMILTAAIVWTAWRWPRTNAR